MWTWLELTDIKCIRKIIRSALDTNPQLEKLLPHVKGNIGFVFTHEDLKDVRDLITDNKVCNLSVSPLVVQMMNQWFYVTADVIYVDIFHCCLPSDAL